MKISQTRPLGIILLVLLFCITAKGQNYQNEEQELLQLSDQKWQWMAAKDTANLAKLFHPQAMFVHMGGKWGREAELRTIGSGAIWYKHAEIHSREVKIADENTGVVYSDIHLTSEVGGHNVRFPFTASEMYLKVNGKWKLLSLIFTRLMERPANNKKTLVAYFSWSGNTKTVAEYIAKKTNADLFRIERVKPYPTEYKPCTEEADRERKAQERPEIKGRIENFDQYDTIFVGCPVWWYEAPMPVYTFLEKSGYDFSGKTVIPFCTFYSGPSSTLDKIVQYTPGAKHLEGLGVKDNHTDKVDAWLKKIGILK